MSDIEDEMDIDAPVADSSISFGGDTKKGKRSAANLPVEAEDSLPWSVYMVSLAMLVTNSFPGWKSTDPIHSQMSKATKTS